MGFLLRKCNVRKRQCQIRILPDRTAVIRSILLVKLKYKIKNLHPPALPPFGNGIHTKKAKTGN